LATEDLQKYFAQSDEISSVMNHHIMGKIAKSHHHIRPFEASYIPDYPMDFLSHKIYRDYKKRDSYSWHSAISTFPLIHSSSFAFYQASGPEQ
jgi:hypothetical protein